MKPLLSILLLMTSGIANASIGDLLSKVTVAPEIIGDDYDRQAHFGGWIDEDGDGKDTRQEVLERESLVPVTWRGNKVISGFWYDPFTGKNVTYPNRPGTKYAVLQIDHIVALKEAWQSGAKNWTKYRKSLTAVSLRIK